MLSRPLQRFLDSIFLRVSGGDTIRADELRMRATGTFLAFIMISYLPLIAAVVVLAMNRPQPVNEAAERDQLSAIEAYATHYVDTYLKDPSNSAAIKQFYEGDVPASALPAGGRALRASSALPGVFLDGFQTYSVVVDAEIPKAANSASMVFVRLQVDISADRKNLFRAFTLPHARPDRPSGAPVELATQTLVSEDRPVYKTVSGLPQCDVDRAGRPRPVRRGGIRFDRRTTAPVHHDGDRAGADQFRPRQRPGRAAQSRRH